MFNIDSITFIKIVRLKALMHSKNILCQTWEYNTVESFQFFERFKRIYPINMVTFKYRN